jgi:hypothetical protein
MRERFLYSRIVWILVALLALSIATGFAEEERTDAGGQWMYVLEGGCATILGCVEERIGALTIPDTLDGYKVTGIEEEALWGDGLTSVTIPDSVTNISP